ncbi:MULTISPECIES: flagellar basal body rod protein FlgC [Neptunomonas]|jgi:flagellar basal-body rod protein FlgC|uniref:Flagellar basal-body rod protein FlgC n=1 Tax=Neptunomonas phycophila TaxID=1572645 RepID=A0AAW7XMG9_9GAMM|nr:MULTISPECIES: flagellar basal body rod protein FlgC [Neptunomonas]MDN2660538.1 flagellar basal body rod protein FlgC [Neptunomonas sp. CHC150]MDO6455270.1 flagellar basal body rod protein FlgC [Neptunomonas phycophila]MDO6469737.1 flagellar basal body rod protein FlgC [Neptunomonas phycophila]QLE96693.1 flagellar basal body rod protein FlgC [Neptunomonas phycophila]
MSLTNIFNIAGSAMSAQTVRLNTTASNMANADSVSSSVEETYRARKPVFKLQEPTLEQMTDSDAGLLPGQGVQVVGIVESEAPLRTEYNPSHPMADADGYVHYPNVNVVEEMADMISASRAFQVNTEIMNTAKQMVQRVLTIGQ